VGVIPTRQLLLQPVVIGAVVEVTKLPKPSMERAGMRPREQAGRNLRERRASLETANVGADPLRGWGRPLPQVPGEQLDPACGPAGVRATACLHREIDATREVPTAEARDFQPGTREGETGP
jgi:hypothetical protein